jgi:glycosyltransferase involved in cell wall biosynthesis
MSDLKFSIILPVHNGGEHIKLCIQSILLQSYTNFELLVLENCSTDGTFEWLKSLNNEKIIIYPSLELLDIQANWKRILDIPKQEYMTLIGHDDLLSPNFLETIAALIENKPTTNLFHTHFNFIDAKGSLINKCRAMPPVYDKYSFIKSILNNSIDVMGTGYVMKSSAYNSMGGFPNYPSFLYCDFELWYSIIASGEMAVSPNTCFSFRIHNNTSKTSAMIKFTTSLNMFVEFLYRASKSDNRIETIVKEDAKNYLLFQCKGLSHLLIKSKAEKNINVVSVQNIVEHTKLWYTKLTGLNDINPLKIKSINVAKIINENIVLQKLYVLFRKIYSKPIF